MIAQNTFFRVSICMYEARFWLLVLGLVYCWCYCLPFEYPKLYTRKFLILISFCTAQHFSLTFISYLVIFFSGFLHTFHSLFWEEISAFAAVDRCYVMGTCYHVWSIVLLPRMVGTSFVLVLLIKLNVRRLNYNENTDQEKKCIM